ncbi:unnamed protein product [Rhizoctonia solani]|uniref:Uncharacterized protein n=1 Tax=Rhizoctonia solani TaxID=456999 RepID=A0A8H3HJE4_9AGAM|nr:unnamed protein product [Rhizoctonia solani]
MPQALVGDAASLNQLQVQRAHRSTLVDSTRTNVDPAGVHCFAPVIAGLSIVEADSAIYNRRRHATLSHDHDHPIFFSFILNRKACSTTCVLNSDNCHRSLHAIRVTSPQYYRL